ncbi:MAG: hypothetical protein HDT29_01495 [Clostridiales bacterium]|nr:hypothetical protein [Clostridiales bacterium]
MTNKNQACGECGVKMVKNNLINACLDFGECCDFCPCDGNRAVSVLSVRDPEGVLVVRAKGTVLYNVGA